MGASKTFQKISGFKRVSTCLGCKQRFTASKENLYYCPTCSKKIAKEREKEAAAEAAKAEAAE